MDEETKKPAKRSASCEKVKAPKAPKASETSEASEASEALEPSQASEASEPSMSPQASEVFDVPILPEASEVSKVSLATTASKVFDVPILIEDSEVSKASSAPPASEVSKSSLAPPASKVSKDSLAPPAPKFSKASLAPPTLEVFEVYEAPGTSQASPSSPVLSENLQDIEKKEREKEAASEFIFFKEIIAGCQDAAKIASSGSSDSKVKVTLADKLNLMHLISKEVKKANEEREKKQKKLWDDLRAFQANTVQSTEEMKLRMARLESRMWKLEKEFFDEKQREVELIDYAMEMESSAEQVKQTLNLLLRLANTATGCNDKMVLAKVLSPEGCGIATTCITTVDNDEESDDGSGKPKEDYAFVLQDEKTGKQTKVLLYVGKNHCTFEEKANSMIRSLKRLLSVLLIRVK